MKVTLLEYTPNALELLIFTKKTRLRVNAEGYENVKKMSEEEKQKELDYVFGTIGSSWEFVDYVFLIEDVTRAFTHQLVRHRVASFAQQAQRVVDLSEDFKYLTTGTVLENPELEAIYDNVMKEIQTGYSELIANGAVPQDARGIIPTNILTNINMKVNLRALSHIMNVRLCYKAQGEFQNVAKAMRDEVLKVHSWAKRVIKVHCAQYGVCQFPGFRECPIRQRGLIPDVDLRAIQEFWEGTLYEAQPKGEKK